MSHLQRRSNHGFRALSILTATVLATASLSTATAGAAGGDPQPTKKVEVIAATHHDVSKPLRQLTDLDAATPSLTTGSPKVVTPNRPMPNDRIDQINAGNPGPPIIPDPTGPGDTEMPALAGSFEGVNNRNGVYPPDTDGDVGPNHYVQMVNISFQIFDKAGNTLFGPANNNVLWNDFGGNCEFTNSGDPIVQYDQAANRWLMSQFTVTGPTYLECVAVSTGPDPTGTWHRYSFPYPELPDYPKFGVWPDGYYVSYNMFAGGTTFTGAKTCALDRAKMLAGLAATQQCVDTATEWSLLPSDVDGPKPPPAGSPNYVLGEHWTDQDKLTMYKFHVDWTTPANSTFTGPITLNVNPFTWACPNVSGKCVPQPSTAQKLDSLGGRAMYRLAYRTSVTTNPWSPTTQSRWTETWASPARQASDGTKSGI